MCPLSDQGFLVEIPVFSPCSVFARMSLTSAPDSCCNLLICNNVLEQPILMFSHAEQGFLPRHQG